MKKIFVFTLLGLILISSVLVSPLLATNDKTNLKMKEGSTDSSKIIENEDDAMMEKTETEPDFMVGKEVKTFDLFWPVAAGKVPGDSLYFLKALKEKIREIFIFSKYQKVDYNIILVEKRFAEAEKLLLENKDVKNSESSFKVAVEKRAVVLKLIEELKAEGTDTLNLADRFHSSLSKQRELLEFWKTKGIEGTDSLFSQDLENISSTEKKLIS